jgi:hypothetical protein
VFLGAEVQSSLLFESTEEIYARVFRELKPRTPVPGISVYFRRFVSANSFIRLHDNHLEVKIADVLQPAPAPIQEALAQILLSKLFRRRIEPHWNDRYRRYLNRPDVREELHTMRQKRGRKRLVGPCGKHHHLEQVFEELNERFFGGLVKRPALSWSPTRSRSLLGHYDMAHEVIVISAILDTDCVKRLALEYVLYHEMLHLRHPVEHNGTRRCVHTTAFKAEERLFPDIELAKKLLRTI